MGTIPLFFLIPSRGLSSGLLVAIEVYRPRSFPLFLCQLLMQEFRFVFPHLPIITQIIQGCFFISILQVDVDAILHQQLHDIHDIIVLALYLHNT